MWCLSSHRAVTQSQTLVVWVKAWCREWESWVRCRSKDILTLSKRCVRASVCLTPGALRSRPSGCGSKEQLTPEGYTRKGEKSSIGIHMWQDCCKWQISIKLLSEMFKDWFMWWKYGQAVFIWRWYKVINCNIILYNGLSFLVLNLKGLQIANVPATAPKAAYWIICLVT